MPFVTEVSEAEAGPELRKLYEQIRDKFGFMPNYFPAQGRAPHLIAAQMALGKAIVEDGELPRATKEQIGLVVSGANTSSYCVALHMELLRTMGIEKALGRKLATNYAGAPVEDRVKVLFQFADKLTRRPADIEEKDAAAVREVWGEAVLFETVLACALFNFYNRVSIGLGLVADF